MLAICTAVFVGAALSAAETVFAPLAFALFTIAIAWPLQKTLQTRMPQLAALALTTGAIVVTVCALALLLAGAVGQVGRFIVGDAERLQALYGSATSWLQGHGIEIGGTWADYFNSNRLIRLAQELSSRLNTLLSFLIVVFVYVLLGLLEVDATVAKLREWRHGSLGTVLLVGGANAAFKLRRYMQVRTQMSIITGLLVYGFALLAGLPLALQWGVLAFGLNFIPFIGPFIATLFPTIFAAAQFASLPAVVAIFTCLNIIQFVVGSYLEPRFVGNALSMSPIVVLFSVFFWTFLWGLPGAFIGVPIVIVLLSLCEAYPSTRRIADLLGGSRPKDDPVPG
ncbi:MAG: AI-2E family transporter [Hyphomicrobium sp.]|nr:MAG: AI-2E family transporter [Hyphomicrobium sp.]